MVKTTQKMFECLCYQVTETTVWLYIPGQVSQSGCFPETYLSGILSLRQIVLRWRPSTKSPVPGLAFPPAPPCLLATILPSSNGTLSGAGNQAKLVIPQVPFGHRLSSEQQEANTPILLR